MKKSSFTISNKKVDKLRVATLKVAAPYITAHQICRGQSFNMHKANVCVFSNILSYFMKWSTAYSKST